MVLKAAVATVWYPSLALTPFFHTRFRVRQRMLLPYNRISRCSRHLFNDIDDIMEEPDQLYLGAMIEQTIVKNFSICVPDNIVTHLPPRQSHATK